MKTGADRLKRLVWSDCKLCKAAIVQKLIVVTTCQYPINPITNPNPRLGHCDTLTDFVQKAEDG
jgi:hypothetical protein